MNDFEIIQIGNHNNSSLILVLPLEFEKIEAISNLYDMIKNYFINDINTIFVTNQFELDQNENGKLLKFIK